jgi:hypothetical protein
MTTMLGSCMLGGAVSLDIFSIINEDRQSTSSGLMEHFLTFAKSLALILP